MSDRDKKLLVYLGALIILAAAYFLVGRPYLDKIDALESQKMNLQTVLSEKQLALSKQDEYKQGIDDAHEKMDEIIAQFPADNADEKSIMFVVNAEKDIPVWISQINFAEETEGVMADDVESYSETEQANLDAAVAEAEGESVDTSTDITATDESGRVGLSDYVTRTTQLGLTYSADYTGFKNMLAYIRDYDERLIISDMSMTYNEKNITTGTFVLSQYALLAPGRELPETETDIDSLGTANVFVAGKDSSNNIISDLMSSLFSNDIVATDSEDFFIEVGGITENTDGITMGSGRNDVAGSTYIISNSNAKEDVVFNVSGSNGRYTATYQVGNDSKTSEFDESSADGTIVLRIISTERMSKADAVAIALHATNDTDIPMMITVESDDNNNPRVDIVEKNGNITVRN